MSFSNTTDRIHLSISIRRTALHSQHAPWECDVPFEMSNEDHCRLASVVHEVTGMVTISGDDCPLYRELVRNLDPAHQGTRWWQQTSRKHTVESRSLREHAGTAPAVLNTGPGSSFVTKCRERFYSCGPQRGNVGGEHGGHSEHDE